MRGGKRLYASSKRGRKKQKDGGKWRPSSNLKVVADMFGRRHETVEQRAVQQLRHDLNDFAKIEGLPNARSCYHELAELTMQGLAVFVTFPTTWFGSHS